MLRIPYFPFFLSPWRPPGDPSGKGSLPNKTQWRALNPVTPYDRHVSWSFETRNVPRKGNEKTVRDSENVKKLSCLIYLL